MDFHKKLVCVLILWMSGLGLLMGKFLKFLTVICWPLDSGGVLLFHVFITIILQRKFGACHFL